MYKHLYTQYLNTEFVINVSDFINYPEVVFSIVDSSIEGVLSYTFEALKNSLNVEEDSKYGISKAIESNGFTCEYKKNQ